MFWLYALLLTWCVNGTRIRRPALAHFRKGGVRTGSRVVRYSTRVVRHETRVVRHETRVMRHGICIVRHGTRLVRPGTRVVRYGTCAVRPSTCALRPGTCAVGPGACAVRTMTYPVQPRNTRTYGLITSQNTFVLQTLRIQRKLRRQFRHTLLNPATHSF